MHFVCSGEIIILNFLTGIIDVSVVVDHLHLMKAILQHIWFFLHLLFFFLIIIVGLKSLVTVSTSIRTFCSYIFDIIVLFLDVSN